jgi:hypothetical protein
VPTTVQGSESDLRKRTKLVLGFVIVVVLALAARVVFHHLRRAHNPTSDDQAEPPQNLATSTVTPMSDDFHRLRLDPRWSFVAPCCGFVESDGTDARLIVPGWTDHDVSGEGNRSVRIMQEIGNVDFEIEVKFNSAVTQQYQEQGIIVEQDGRNLLRFDIYSDGRMPRLFAASLKNQLFIARHNVGIFGTAPLWMRVKRAGDLWTQSWSVDGSSFTETAPFGYHLKVERIGVFAGNAGAKELNIPAPSFTALVDYFFNRASPIRPTDGGEPPAPLAPLIDLWYGDVEEFGQHGMPQQWINVLGTVSDPVGVSRLTYSLNGGNPENLALGPTYPRLVDTGDFNAEIDHSRLIAGKNIVKFTATDTQGRQAQRTVTITYADDTTWPLPYTIDWSKVPAIQTVAQVIDGKWSIQPDGTVRTMRTGYDRLITFGDMKSWMDYEVTGEVTAHAFDCHDYGVGIVVGWQGHTSSDNGVMKPDQPRTGHSFPGLGWISTLGSNLAPHAQFNIYANTAATPEAALAADTSGRLMLPGVKYIFKFQNKANIAGGSHYSLKVWPAAEPEPEKWDLEADGQKAQGSVVLGAHQVDVSFGKITVVPVH